MSDRRAGVEQNPGGIWNVGTGYRLDSTDDWSRYLDVQNKRLFNLHHRVSDREADALAMSKDLQQLVQWRVATKKSINDDGSLIVPAILAAVLQRPAVAAAAVPAATVPVGGTVHDDPTTPPTVAAGSALTTLGFTAALDPSVINTDSSGVIILTNTGGPFSFVGNTPIDLATITYGAGNYNTRPHVDGYVEENMLLLATSAPVVYMLSPKLGGLVSGCTLQAITSGAGQVATGGTVKLSYRVTPRTGG